MAEAGHGRHDLLAVAGSLGGPMPAWIAACAACGRVLADLMRIRRAVRAAPTPGRPRDYRLSAAQAGRLRVARWRRWLDAVGTPGDHLTRPLGATLASRRARPETSAMMAMMALERSSAGNRCRRDIVRRTT